MHVPLHPAQLAQHLQHVHRQPDRPRRIGETTLDRLADPPHRVGGELVALGVVELLDRTDQAQVPFLHHVEQGQAPVAVLLGHRHDQAQVRLEHVRLGAPPVFGHQFQVTPEGLVQPGRGLQLVLGEQTSLDPLGQVHLLLGREQAGAPDGLEVGVDRVAHGGRLVVQVNFGKLVGLGLQGHNIGVGHVDIGVVRRVRPGPRRLSLSGTRGRRTRRTAPGTPLGPCWPRQGRFGLGQLVGQPHAGLAQLTQNGPSLGRRESCLVKGRPQLRKRQVTLASPALDQVIHPGRARLVIRVGDTLDC